MNSARIKYITSSSREILERQILVQRRMIEQNEQRMTALAQDNVRINTFINDIQTHLDK